MKSLNVSLLNRRFITIGKNKYRIIGVRSDGTILIQSTMYIKGSQYGIIEM